MRKETPIVIFQSDRFDLTWPDESEIETNPWGRDLAVWLVEQLASNGVRVVDNDPCLSYGGWVVDAQVRDEHFALLVQWTCMSETTKWTPESHYWIVQTWKRRGCLAALFQKATAGETTAICQPLHQILDTNPDFKNVQWLTDEEFRRVY